MDGNSQERNHRNKVRDKQTIEQKEEEPSCDLERQTMRGPEPDSAEDGEINTEINKGYIVCRRERCTKDTEVKLHTGQEEKL